MELVGWREGVSPLMRGLNATAEMRADAVGGSLPARTTRPWLHICPALSEESASQPEPVLA